jgi:hypothetical protein
MPGSASASKNSSFLTQKIVYKLSELWSRMFLPDPDLYFYPSRIPDPGVKKAPDPDPQHWVVVWETTMNNSAFYGDLRANTGILMKRRDLEICTHKSPYIGT